MLKSKKIILIVLIFLIISGILFFVSHTIYEEKISPPFSPSYVEEGRVEAALPAKTVLEINGERYEGEIAGKTSVYDFMNKLRAKGKINFAEKNYAGMGKFIVSINGVRGDGNKNWIYYVNGAEAQVGVSNYKIKSGDIISWKYE